MWKEVNISKISFKYGWENNLTLIFRNFQATRKLIFGFYPYSIPTKCWERHQGSPDPNMDMTILATSMNNFFCKTFIINEGKQYNSAFIGKFACAIIHRLCMTLVVHYYHSQTSSHQWKSWHLCLHNGVEESFAPVNAGLLGVGNNF